MVEFALVFVLFFVVLLALMEFARGMWTYVTVAQTARQAAAYLMVHGTMDRPTRAEFRAVVRTAATDLNLSALDVDVLLNPDDDDPGTNPALALRGDIVEVKISYPFRLVTGGPGDRRQHHPDGHDHARGRGQLRLLTSGAACSRENRFDTTP